MPPPRHFLDIDCIDSATLRRIVDMGHAMKKAGKRVPAKLRPAGIAVSSKISAAKPWLLRKSFSCGVFTIERTSFSREMLFAIANE